MVLQYAKTPGGGGPPKPFGFPGVISNVPGRARRTQSPQFAEAARANYYPGDHLKFFKE